MGSREVKCIYQVLIFCLENCSPRETSRSDDGREEACLHRGSLNYAAFWTIPSDIQHDSLRGICDASLPDRSIAFKKSTWMITAIFRNHNPNRLLTNRVVRHSTLYESARIPRLAIFLSQEVMNEERPPPPNQRGSRLTPKGTSSGSLFPTPRFLNHLIARRVLKVTWRDHLRI